MDILMKKKSAAQQRGFTLLQTAIIVVILGLMAAAAAAQYRIYLRNAYIKTNAERQEIIRSAIRNFYADHGRLPCAARNDLTPNDANFGRELTGAACTAGTTGNTKIVAGQAGGLGNVRIGSVPVRTLGIDDTFIMNGSGYRFFYAVTVNLTTGTTAVPADLTKGTIDVCSGASATCVGTNSVLTTTSVPAPAGNCAGLPYTPPIAPNAPRYAVYLVIDPGRSGIGAYTLNGVAVPGGCTGGKDAWNCGSTSIFRGGSYVCTKNENGGYTYLYTPQSSFSNQ